jgi:hypothetical protein
MREVHIETKENMREFSIQTAIIVVLAYTLTFFVSFVDALFGWFFGLAALASAIVAALLCVVFEFSSRKVARSNSALFVIGITLSLGGFFVKTYGGFQYVAIVTSISAPTLARGDTVLVERYGLFRKKRSLNIGTLVLVRGKSDQGEALEYVRRVAAVGMQTIETRGEQLYVNGSALSMPYKGSPISLRQLSPEQILVVPENHDSAVDNLANPIQVGQVIGIVKYRIKMLGLKGVEHVQ